MVTYKELVEGGMPPDEARKFLAQEREEREREPCLECGHPKEEHDFRGICRLCVLEAEAGQRPAIGSCLPPRTLEEKKWLERIRGSRDATGYLERREELEKVTRELPKEEVVYVTPERPPKPPHVVTGVSPEYAERLRRELEKEVRYVPVEVRPRPVGVPVAERPVSIPIEMMPPEVPEVEVPWPFKKTRTVQMALAPEEKVPVPVSYREIPIHPPWAPGEISGRLETMGPRDLMRFEFDEGNWLCRRAEPDRWECSATYYEEYHSPGMVMTIGGRRHLVPSSVMHRVLPAVKGGSPHVARTMLVKKPLRVVELKV